MSVSFTVDWAKLLQTTIVQSKLQMPVLDLTTATSKTGNEEQSLPLNIQTNPLPIVVNHSNENSESETLRLWRHDNRWLFYLNRGTCRLALGACSSNQVYYPPLIFLPLLVLLLFFLFFFFFILLFEGTRIFLIFYLCCRCPQFVSGGGEIGSCSAIEDSPRLVEEAQKSVDDFNMAAVLRKVDVVLVVKFQHQFTLF